MNNCATLLRLRKGSLSILLLLLFAAPALAQQTIKGKITDASTGSPIAGATIRALEGKASRNTVTNNEGQFSIQVQNAATAKLIISHISYKSQVVELEGKSDLAIQLTSEEDVMNDVVVIGYGSQRKSHLTGAISKLGNRNLDEIPASRLDNVLQGKIAGVSIQNVDNEAGAAPKIRVRGTSSISAGSDPLVVVDGVPVPDGLAFVDPYDVASIEVLKDAASSAIYGSRGANGVILVTTKQGNSGQPKYTFKTYYGIKQAYELNPIMTFSDYAEKLYAEAAMRENDPTVPSNRTNLISSQERAAYIVENQINGRPTDWQNMALRDAAIYNVQLGVSGGRSDLKYYLSGNWQQDQGLMKFSQNNKASFKARVNGRLSRKLAFNVNFTPSYMKIDRPTANFTDYYRFYSFLPVYHSAFTAQFAQQNPQWADIKPGDWAQARHFNGLPYTGVMPDGTIWKSSGVVSPFSTSNNTPLSIASRINRATTYYRLLGTGDLTYTIVPGLDFKTALSGYFNQSEDNTYAQSNAKKDGDVNYASLQSRQYKDLLWENTLNYKREQGRHHFDVLLGYTAEKTYLDTSNMYGNNFPTEDFRTLNQAGQIDQSKTYTLQDQVGLVSYLGRLTYDYNGKYLLSASLRTDGSSYFASGKKYGWFPSISAGWVVSREPFLQQAMWLSNLKLRASYGATGNNSIPSFAYQDLLYPANYDFGAGTGNTYLGLAPSSSILANPYITWERTFEYNAGMDLGLWSNRLNLSLDYYNARTDRLLLQQTTMSFSGSNVYWNNAGSVTNQGLELELRSTNMRNSQMEWTTALNISGNRNSLSSLGGVPYLYSYGERNEIYAAIIGQPSVQFFGYKTDGVWTSDEEISDAKAKGLKSDLSKYFQTGGLKLVDVNNDNIIDANDRVPLGDPFPDFTWGITNNISFKGFDLSFLIQGVQGGSLINGDSYYNETKKFNRNFNSDSRWVSAANPGDGKTPYFTNGFNWMLTDYVIEDASYAALRNIIIGYTLPQSWARKATLKNVRIYGAIDNAFYIMGKGYRGINPEARSTSSQYRSPLIDGYQRGAFPVARTYTLAVDLNF